MEDNIIVLYPLVLDSPLAQKTREAIKQTLLLKGLNNLEKQGVKLTIVK